MNSPVCTRFIKIRLFETVPEMAAQKVNLSSELRRSMCESKEQEEKRSNDCCVIDRTEQPKSEAAKEKEENQTANAESVARDAEGGVIDAERTDVSAVVFGAKLKKLKKARGSKSSREANNAKRKAKQDQESKRSCVTRHFARPGLILRAGSALLYTVSQAQENRFHSNLNPIGNTALHLLCSSSLQRTAKHS